MSRPTRACELKSDKIKEYKLLHGSRPTRACELKLQIYIFAVILYQVAPHAGV